MWPVPLATKRASPAASQQNPAAPAPLVSSLETWKVCRNRSRAERRSKMKLFKSAIEQDRLRSRLCYEGFDSNLDIDE